MLHLIIGGSGSGKSEYAENICLGLSSRPDTKLYIATMEPFGEEGARRIARHHALRAGKGFDTLECYTHLEEADLSGKQVILLECMSNLVANEIFSPKGRPDRVCQVILKGVDHLLEENRQVVIVTNDVFSDGLVYDQDTENYREILAQVNRQIADRADRVTEVVCGIPLELRESV